MYQEFEASAATYSIKEKKKERVCLKNGYRTSERFST
jgi:hypothetical protein